MVRIIALVLVLTSCSQAFGQGAGGDLARRIARAKPGETIRVKPGSYGVVSLEKLRFARPVRVEAKDANFTAINLRDVEGVTWVGGTVTGPGGRSYAMNVRGVKRVRIEGMTLTGAHRGLVLNESEDVELVGNRLTGLLAEGINVALSRRVKILNNVCRDFRPTLAVFDDAGRKLRDGDHPDCIQGWSRPSRAPMSDILVEGNDAEGNMQGIFFGNHRRDGVDDGGYDRVVIRNNLIKVTSPIGVTLTDGRDSQVTGNIVDTVPGSVLPNNRSRLVRATIRVNDPGTSACGNRVSAAPDSTGTQSCGPRQ